MQTTPSTAEATPNAESRPSRSRAAGSSASFPRVSISDDTRVRVLTSVPGGARRVEKHGTGGRPTGRGRDDTVTMKSGIDLSFVDSAIRPQDDLFGHVNGRWLADYQIPADRATDGAFRALFDQAEEQVRDLITGAAESDPAPGTDEQRIGDLYASFMDEATVARVGLAPLPAEMTAIDGCTDASELAAVVGRLQRSGVGGGAGVYVDTDAKDSTRYLLHVNQSGLGLPDESY